MKIKYSIATSDFLEPELLNKPTLAVRERYTANVTSLWGTLNQQNSFAINQDRIAQFIKLAEEIIRILKLTRRALIPVL